MIALHSASRPTVSILILTQDQLGHLGNCLTALAQILKGSSIAYEVVVVFNGTETSAARTFAKNLQGVRVHAVALNLGFGSGNNFAARQARGEYFVFLNDDAIVEAGWLDALVRTAETRPDAGAVGSRILFIDGSLQEAGGIIWSDGSTRPLGRGAVAGSLAYSYVRSVDYASANGLLVRRASFDALGGFDSRYFPAYYEDADLCLGIRHRLEQDVLYEPRAIVRHVESASTNDQAFRSFLFRRNQALLHQKWLDVLATYPVPEPDSPEAVAGAVLKRRGDPLRILVIDDRLPDAGLGSGFVRSCQLFAELNIPDFAVAFYPSDGSQKPRENTLADLGVDLIEDDLVEHLGRPQNAYNVVIISRPHNAEFLKTIKDALPQAKIIYDAEALYHKRLRIQAQLERHPEKRVLQEVQAEAMERFEATIVRSVDRLVAISYAERDWMGDVSDHAPIDLMVPLLDHITATPLTTDDRDGAVFVAGWLAGDDSPNVDALRWYCEYVLPIIRATLPGFRTLVTGKNPPLNLQMSVGEAVTFTGFVDSMPDLYRSARVAIAPIRVGAGVKIKTMEALQYGVPVVATNVGAEGLRLQDGIEIDIADEPVEFAARIIALVRDPDLWLARRRAVAMQLAIWENQRVGWPDIIRKTLSGSDAKHRPEATRRLEFSQILP